MNEFIAEYFPSLLLFDTGLGVRFFWLLFVIVFFVSFLFFEGKNGIFGHNLGEQSHRNFGSFLAVFLFGVIVLGGMFLVNQEYSSSEYLQKTDDAGYVLVGRSEEQSKGKVLGETDISLAESPVPKSENFRLGFITVGGDNQMYLSNAEDKKLDILGIGYKTVIDENRENTGAIIRWKTNKPSRGEVLYRKSSDAEFRSAKEDSFGWEHTIVLEKLGYSSTYVFSISASDKWGNLSKSENYALYSGSNSPSLFDLLASAFGDIFGWAIKK